MKKFGELTREEKGKLLLAQHEGKQIQVYVVGRGWYNIPEALWTADNCYRVKPERVDGLIRTVITDADGDPSLYTLYGTFEVDEKGKPDVSSWIPNS